MAYCYSNTAVSTAGQQWRYQSNIKPLIYESSWISTRLHYLQCISNGDTTVLAQVTSQRLLKLAQVSQAAMSSLGSVLTKSCFSPCHEH